MRLLILFRVINRHPILFRVVNRHPIFAPGSILFSRPDFATERVLAAPIQSLIAAPIRGFPTESAAQRREAGLQSAHERCGAQKSREKREEEKSVKGESGCEKGGGCEDDDDANDDANDVRKL